MRAGPFAPLVAVSLWPPGSQVLRPFPFTGEKPGPCWPPSLPPDSVGPDPRNLGRNRVYDTCGPPASADTQRRGALRPGGPGGGEGTRPGPGPRAQRGWWEQSPRAHRSRRPRARPAACAEEEEKPFHPSRRHERFRSDAVFCAKGAAGVRGQAVNTADKLRARKI